MMSDPKHLEHPQVGDQAKFQIADRRGSQPAGFGDFTSGWTKLTADFDYAPSYKDVHGFQHPDRSQATRRPHVEPELLRKFATHRLPGSLPRFHMASRETPIPAFGNALRAANHKILSTTPEDPNGAATNASGNH